MYKFSAKCTSFAIIVVSHYLKGKIINKILFCTQFYHLSFFLYKTMYYIQSTSKINDDESNFQNIYQLFYLF